MKLFNNITFRLWLPNAAILLVGITAFALYYPRHQRSLLKEQKNKELTEMARSIAMGIELSLDASNFSGLSKTINYFTSNKKNISVLVMSDADVSNSGVDIIASFPKELEHLKLLKDSSEYLWVKIPFKSNSFSGKVYVFEPEQALSDMLWTLNFPTYVLLFVSLTGFLVVFYFVAMRVSNPIRELNSYASSLITDVEIKSTRSESGNELEMLKESLHFLKKSVEKEAQKNSELTKSLETEVENRTSELSRKNTYLEHAAKILRHDMHSGINTYLPRGINSLLRRLNPELIEANSLDAPIRLIKEGLSHTQKVYQGIYEFTNLVKPGSKLNLVERNLRDLLISFLSSTSYKDQVEIKDLGMGLISESLFCTAVDNLIRNGLKYNDSPTKVVRISRLEGDVIEVLDNGRGLTQEEFELFSRTGTRREGQKEAGSGLGLGICVAILQEHGFKISCDKLAETGSSIKIQIA